MSTPSYPQDNYLNNLHIKLTPHRYKTPTLINRNPITKFPQECHSIPATNQTSPPYHHNNQDHIHQTLPHLLIHINLDTLTKTSLQTL